MGNASVKDLVLVRVEEREAGRVAYVTVNNPGRRNILGIAGKKALAGASLLFIGYRLADWNFRVLHRGLVMAGESSLRRLSVTVHFTSPLVWISPRAPPVRNFWWYCRFALICTTGTDGLNSALAGKGALTSVPHVISSIS